MTEENIPERTPVGFVIAQWKKPPALVEQAAGGMMCKIGSQKDLNRLEVCQNAEILEPVIQHLGVLSQFSTCMDMSYFMLFSRIYWVILGY